MAKGSALVGRSALIGGVVLLIAGFVGLVWLDARNDTLRAQVVPDTIVWYLIAFAGFVLVLVGSQSFTQDRSGRFGTLGWLLLLGLGLRLVMVATEPTLSDDVYRYLWEGHLVTEGVSPYSFAIDAPAGDAYDIPARSLANNTSLGSPYLPVAHVIFGATSLVLPSESWSMQLLMIALDVLAATMILKLLKLARLPKSRVLLYWLNPLVILEVAHGAHIDAMIVGLASAGLLLSLDRSRSSQLAMYGGPLLIAAATLTRPLAVLFVPVLFWLWNWRQRITWAVAVVAPIAIVGAVSGLGLGDSGSGDSGSGDSGTGVFGSARAYTESFRFNSAFYQRFEAWIGSRGLDDKGWNEPVALTRLIVAAVVATVLLAIFVFSRRELARSDVPSRTALRLLALPLIVYVVATPVLHPWYTLLLLSVLPFLAPAVNESPTRWFTVVPWLALSCLLIFSYLTYENPAAFAERPWIGRLEWYPTLALLVGGAVAMWFARSTGLHVASVNSGEAAEVNK